MHCYKKQLADQITIYDHWKYAYKYHCLRKTSFVRLQTLDWTTAMDDRTGTFWYLASYFYMFFFSGYRYKGKSPTISQICTHFVSSLYAYIYSEYFNAHVSILILIQNASKIVERWSRSTA